MNARRLWMAVSLLFALSSCATTRYEPISANPGSQTGYAEAQLDSVTWNVGFFANLETDTITLNRYMLYRAAELTAQHGFDYFVVLDHSSQSESPGAALVAPPAKVSCPDPMKPALPVGWDYATSFHSGSRSAAVTVRMMHGTYPASNPNAYSARFLLASIGPTIER